MQERHPKRAFLDITHSRTAQQSPTQRHSARRSSIAQNPRQLTPAADNSALFVDNAWDLNGSHFVGNVMENPSRSSMAGNFVPTDFNSYGPASSSNYGYGPNLQGRLGSVPSTMGSSFMQVGQQGPHPDYGASFAHDGGLYSMGDFHGNGNFQRTNPGLQHHVNLTASLPTDATATNGKNLRPIHIAATGGNLKAVEWILEVEPQCVNLETADGATAIIQASQEGHTKIIKLLCDMNADVNATWKECSRKAIHQAAQGGHTDAVELLLRYGSEHDPVDIHGATPFWTACQGGHESIVQMLLQKGAQTEPLTDNGRSPIHQAAQNGHINTVEILLNAGVNVDTIDEGITPLWSASQGGHHEIVKLLLDKGADTEPMSKKTSRRPIHQASQNGHHKVVEALLDGGALADPEEESFEKNCPSPLYLAAQSGHYDVAKILLKHKADPNFYIRASGNTPLLAAIHEGAVKTAELLLDHGADIGWTENDGWPPLMMASQKGSAPMVRLLLSRGAAVNAEEKDGATALWIAAQQGHALVVSMLLAANAKSMPTKKSGRRPIHQASQNGHFNVVKMLVEHDEDEVGMTDFDGATPIGLAAHGKEAHRLAMMKYLHSKGGNLVGLM